MRHPYIWPLLLAVGANGLIAADAAPWLRYSAALLLLAFLPGWLLLAAAAIRVDPPAGRLVLAVGLSLALTILGAMLAVYLPGPLALPPLLGVMNGLILAAAGVAWFRRPVSPAPPAVSPAWAILVALLLLAALLRLPRLGYAEFHEDEAEALMLGVRLMQGEDYALFLHRKGPAQMLVPVAFWLLSGRVTEAAARLPFALSSILSVAVIFFLGRRWFSPPAAALAALLWALNGYAVAFGRMVQYQALIFFLGPLALYCLVLAWQERRPRLLPVAALLLAACLLAHFDALLLLPAAAYLGWLAARAGRAYRPALLSLLLLGLLLAAFYLPYFLDPEFQNTAAYLSESRVGSSLLYNNLPLLAQLDRDYSSRFYLPLAGLGLLIFASRQALALNPARRWPAAGLGLLAASTWGLPGLWRVGPLSLAGLPWLLLGLVYLRAASPAGRAAWLLFGAPWLGYVFLVGDPRTHLYILYPGAALVAGAGWAGLGRLAPSFGFRAVAPLLAGLLGLAAVAVAGYQYLLFLPTESAQAAVRAGWTGSVQERLYDDLPGVRDYFGYPKREGWKAIGALRAGGAFPGDFRSVNEDFIIPIWYNYGEPRSCYNTPAVYLVRVAGQDPPAAEMEGYRETARVQREGDIRLRVLTAGPAPAAPAVYSLETLAPGFDRQATPHRFVQQVEPSQPAGVMFGPAIRFVGYDLPAKTVKPGQTLHLNLYWQALAAPQAAYRAFVHLTDGSRLWAQQDDDPICRLPTAIWRPGQRGLGQFRLAIDATTPPGRYPLIIGLYRADTLERLKISGGAGQVGDDFLWLGDIEVVE